MQTRKNIRRCIVRIDYTTKPRDRTVTLGHRSEINFCRKYIEKHSAHKGTRKHCPCLTVKSIFVLKAGNDHRQGYICIPKNIRYYKHRQIRDLVIKGYMYSVIIKSEKVGYKIPQRQNGKQQKQENLFVVFDKILKGAFQLKPSLLYNMLSELLDRCTGLLSCNDVYTQQVPALEALVVDTATGLGIIVFMHFPTLGNVITKQL